MRTFDEYGERFDGNGSMMLVTDALADKEEAVQFNKGELIEKQKYILELEGQIAALTEDRDKWQSKAHYQNQDNLRLTAELKSLTEAYNNTDWKKRTDVLIEVIKLVYRKHHLNDDSIGWEELSYTLHNTIYEAIGDQEYLNWINALKQGKEAGDETITKEAITASRK